MAAAYARALLDEVETIRLDELLLAIPLHRPPRPTGLSSLDALLLPLLAAPSGPRRRPPIIEIAGVGPCSGKTQLLHRIVASLILGRADTTSPGAAVPQRLEHGSSNAGVVIWLDLAGRFSAARLDAVAKSAAARVNASPSKDRHAARTAHCAPTAFPSTPSTTALPDTDALSTSARLQHVYVRRPASFAALVSALHSLPTTLLSSPFLGSDHPSASARLPVAAIVLSELGTFHAVLRRDAAVAAADDGAVPAHRTLSAHYAELLGAVRDVQDRLGCAVFASVGAREPGVAGVGVRPRDDRDGGLGGGVWTDLGAGAGGVAWEAAVDARVVVRRAGDKDRTARFEAAVVGRAGREAGRFGFMADAESVVLDGEISAV